MFHVLSKFIMPKKSSRTVGKQFIRWTQNMLEFRIEKTIEIVCVNNDKGSWIANSNIAVKR